MNHILENRLTTASPVALVTGGAGFIGSHVVDALLEEGFRVVVIDNLSTGKLANLNHATGSRLKFIEADVCDGLFAATYDLGARIELVVHLAAQTSVARSMASPLSDARSNYLGTMQVLEYARLVGAKRVVFISSSAVYGNVTSVPIGESNPTAPLSPYGVHKLLGEVLLGYYRDAHGMSVAAFRLFNVYGPRQDPGSPYSGVISVFAKRALANEPLTIYGDGMQSRDFVFVADVVRAIIAAGTQHDTETGVFNIGTGNETTINDLAKTIIDLTGSRSRICYEDRRAGDVHRSLADISSATTRLGYKPRVSLRKGLSATLAWMGAEGEVLAPVA
jgi:UDP-glucose 4-epimerase